MKAAIARAGLATADLLERADVEARYSTALARLAEADRLRGASAADAPAPTDAPTPAATTSAPAADAPSPPKKPRTEAPPAAATTAPGSPPARIEVLWQLEAGAAASRVWRPAATEATAHGVVLAYDAVARHGLAACRQAVEFDGSKVKPRTGLPDEVAAQILAFADASDARPWRAPVAPADDAALDAALPDVAWSKLTNLKYGRKMPAPGGDGVWTADSLMVEVEGRPGVRVRDTTSNLDFPYESDPARRQALFLGAARRAGPAITSLGTEGLFGRGPTWNAPPPEDESPGDVLCGALPAALPNLRHLSLSDVPRRADLLGAVAAWPALVSLDVVDARWIHERDRAAQAQAAAGGNTIFAGLARHEGLRYVSLPCCGIEQAVAAVATLLAACPNLACLDATSLEIEDPDDFDEIRRVCRGSQLRCLVATTTQMVCRAPYDMDEGLADYLGDSEIPVNILGDWRAQVDKMMKESDW